LCVVYAHTRQVLAHCSLIKSCAENLARDCMPAIDRIDVREGVRGHYPPAPDHCIAQVPHNWFHFYFILLYP
jgi:hypothetical protein